jgi:hypothetical protein
MIHSMTNIFKKYEKAIYLVLMALLFPNANEVASLKVSLYRGGDKLLITRTVHGDGQRGRISQGVRQAALFWKETDGSERNLLIIVVTISSVTQSC